MTNDAAGEEQIYRLAFLFDASDGRQEIEAAIKEALAKELHGIDLNIQLVGKDLLRVEIAGSAPLIDACHQKLNKQVCTVYRFDRSEDSLGEQIRAEAYPILARLETALRRFIADAMTQVFGLSWWDRLGVKQVTDRVADVREKHSSRGLQHHEIELTEFEHLVLIITADMPSWSDDRALTVGDLQDLLQSCTTIQEVRAQLVRKTEKATIWDHVFSRFFSDADEWKAAKHDLIGTVVQVRHKVMHHRPVWRWELEKLQTAADRVHRVLSLRKPSMGAAEKVEAKEAMTAVINAVTFTKALEQYLAQVRPIKSAARTSFFDQVSPQQIVRGMEAMRGAAQLSEGVREYAQQLSANQEAIRRSLSGARSMFDMQEQVRSALQAMNVLGPAESGAEEVSEQADTTGERRTDEQSGENMPRREKSEAESPDAQDSTDDSA